MTYCGTDKQQKKRDKCQIYNSLVKSTVIYQTETCKFNKNLESEYMLIELMF